MGVIAEDGEILLKAYRSSSVDRMPMAHFFSQLLFNTGNLTLLQFT